MGAFHTIKAQGYIPLAALYIMCRPIGGLEGAVYMYGPQCVTHGLLYIGLVNYMAMVYLMFDWLLLQCGFNAFRIS